MHPGRWNALLCRVWVLFAFPGRCCRFISGGGGLMFRPPDGPPLLPEWWLVCIPGVFPKPWPSNVDLPRFNLCGQGSSLGVCRWSNRSGVLRAAPRPRACAERARFTPWAAGVHVFPPTVLASLSHLSLLQDFCLMLGPLWLFSVIPRSAIASLSVTALAAQSVSVRT